MLKTIAWSDLKKRLGLQILNYNFSDLTFVQRNLPSPALNSGTTWASCPRRRQSQEEQVTLGSPLVLAMIWLC